MRQFSRPRHRPSRADHPSHHSNHPGGAPHHSNHAGHIPFPFHQTNHLRHGRRPFPLNRAFVLSAGEGVA